MSTGMSMDESRRGTAVGVFATRERVHATVDELLEVDRPIAEHQRPFRPREAVRRPGDDRHREAPAPRLSPSQ